jgi:hypothetical protein
LLAQGYAANFSALRPLQQLLSLSNTDAAAVCGVNVRTYRNWLRGSFQPPASVLKLFAVLAGYMPWEGWEGWQIQSGVLYPPGFSRGGMTAGEFFAVGFYRQLVSEQRRQLAELEARVAFLQSSAAARGVGAAAASQRTGTE